MINIPNIRSNSIMDKCVIDEFVSEVNDTFSDAKSKIDNCIGNIEAINELINNTILISTNKNIDKKETLMYDERFLDASKIDMSSSCEFDFEKGECRCPCVSKNIVNFNKISLDGNQIDHLSTPNSSIYSYSVSGSSDTTIECIFNNISEINTVYAKIVSNTPYVYNIYNSIGSADTLISTGTSSNSIHSSFAKIKTNKIKIVLSYNDKASVSLSYITGYLSIYANYSEFLSKEIKLYNGTSNIKVNVNSNTNDYKSYIGYINKDNNIIWNNGDESIKFNTSISNEKVVQQGYPSFGSTSGVYKKLLNIPAATNLNSIKVLSGYGSWRYTLINGAFMSDDLTVIQYTSNDIVEEKFVDCENYSYNIVAGDLVILEQTFESDVTVRATVPPLYAIKNSTDDYTSHFRYKVVFNGERVTNVYHDTDIELEIKKGVNTMQIIFNLKKDDADSSYSVVANNDINFKNYSNRIYYNELIQSTSSFLTNDSKRECYSVYNGSIVVNEIIDGDRMYISYEEYIDSDIHYRDYLGQYMKVIIKVCMYDRDGKHTVIDRIRI